MRSDGEVYRVDSPPEGQRGRRRHLPPLIRYPIIAAWGVALAVAVFYILRKLGY